jgi:hypothetical protein
MVAITYRTLGPWGGGKGANLLPSEVDTNFYELARAIVDIQDNPEQPNGIYSITVSGTQMTITLNDGTVLGPYTLPVLTFRWRGEFQPGAPYAVLDVFTFSSFNPYYEPTADVKYGIFLVQVAGTYALFDPDLVTDGVPVYKQLFGAVDTLLRTLGDVQIDGTPDDQGNVFPVDRDTVVWHADDQRWHNETLGDMAFQWPGNVYITGGQIHGMSAPISPGDVATKAYVDALPAGMTAAPNTMMANIAVGVAPALPNTLSDFLDAVLFTTIRGTMLYRSGTGWVALPPGPDGYYLQTHAAGADPTWELGGSGVVSIAPGTGIDTGGGTIHISGTISLAAVSDRTILANVSGAVAAPTPQTLSLILDGIIGNARGTILARNISGWVGLAPGTNGYYLKTQGTGADVMWDSPVGSGTLTSISAGAGISTGGAPITSSGTVSLATIAADTILANNTPSTAVPTSVSLSMVMDRVFGAVQGSVLFRGIVGWQPLIPGAAGQVLTTAGSTANPSWQNAPITGSSTPNQRIVSNISGSTAVPTGNTLTNILDAIISSARGTLLYRTNSGWVGLAPGTAGQVLQTGGGSGDPSWITNAGGSIAISAPQAQDTLSYNTSSGKFENVRPRYEIGAYVPGVMSSASQNLLFHKFPKAITLPANLGAYLGHSSQAGGSATATGSTAIVLAKALAASPTTYTTVATITIAAGSVNGSMSTQAAITFAQGDRLRIRGPASPDPTFADLHITLVGFET